jgi:methyl-accepting chemotaxis protein
MNIGNKIMIAAIGAVALTTVAGLFVQRSIIRTQGLASAQAKMAAAIAQAESTRNSFGELAQAKAFDEQKLIEEAKTASDIRATSFYKTIPVVAAWRGLEDLAKTEGYQFRVPKNNPRNSANAPTPAEKEILDQFESGKLKEFFEVDEANNRIVFAKPIALTADCMKCHGDPATSPTGDGRDPLGFAMENWKAGEVHGAFILTDNFDDIHAATKAGTWQVLMYTVPLGVVIAGVFFAMNRKMIVKPLTDVINSIAASSAQTQEASGQVSQSAQSLSQGASEQAASLEQSSAALEEVSAMTKRNAETAQQAAALAAQSQTSAGEGNAAMEKMNAAIAQIEQRASETAKIIKTIDEIAFQTNLLALNAAVEAARAGEAGKGFAVVAEEVRNLAMRSAEAAKNTSEMIQASVESSREGVQIAGEVGTVLKSISENATKVAGLVGEIASASREQSTGVSEVTAAVSQMDKVTQTNAATAEESAASAEELAAQAQELVSAVKTLAGLVGAQLPQSSSSSFSNRSSSRNDPQPPLRMAA